MSAERLVRRVFRFALKTSTFAHLVGTIILHCIPQPCGLFSTCPRVLLYFELYGDAWNVHFSQDGCRSPSGSRTRYFKFGTVDSLRAFLTRCQPEDATLPVSTNSVRAWNRGSEYVGLTAE